MKTKRQPKTKSVSKPAAEPEDPNLLIITVKPGESNGRALARKVIEPAVSAAVTTSAFRPATRTDLELPELARELRDQCAKVRSGDLGRAEEMLIAQAHTLDAIFNRLALHAAANIGTYMGTADTYMKLALRAQSQARTTLEALSHIKNPPVYATQNNIAHGPQQVNNGTRSEPDCGSPGVEMRPNELLEVRNGEGLDTRTPGQAGSGNSPMEAVGAVHRAKDADRQG